MPKEEYNIIRPTPIPKERPEFSFRQKAERAILGKMKLEFRERWRRENEDMAEKQRAWDNAHPAPEYNLIIPEKYKK